MLYLDISKIPKHPPKLKYFLLLYIDLSFDMLLPVVTIAQYQ